MEVRFVESGSSDIRVSQLDKFFEVGTIDILGTDATEYVVTPLVEDGDSKPFVVTVNETHDHPLQAGEDHNVYNESFTVHAKALERNATVTYRLLIRAAEASTGEEILFTVRS